MGILTQANLHPWYKNLSKSFLTPPDILFAIVWPILYVLLAIVGLNLFIKDNLFSAKKKWIYSTQLILNCLWTPIFFSLHRPDLALIILILMVGLTTILMYELHDKHKTLTFLLIPYLIWILFATYLNAVIWLAA